MNMDIQQPVRIYTASGKLRNLSKWAAIDRLRQGAAKVWVSGPAGTVLMPVKRSAK
jgi:hypothetical protein